MLMKAVFVATVLVAGICFAPSNAGAQGVYGPIYRYPSPLVQRPPMLRPPMVPIYRPYIPAYRYTGGGIYSNWGMGPAYPPVNRYYRAPYRYGGWGGYPVYGAPYVTSGVSVSVGW